MNISEKVAIVTGGASGLGRATAEMLTENGASVVLIDLPSQPGEAVAAELGAKAMWAPADVTNGDQVAEVVQRAVERFGGIQILVNCAGIATVGRVISRTGPLPLEPY